MRVTCLMLPLAAMLWLAPDSVLGQSVELRAAHRQVTDLYEKGRYEEAMPFAEETIRLSEQEFGAEHPTTATLIDNLAELHRERGSLAEAESLFNRALAIRQTSLAPDHPDLAASNDSLGTVMSTLGRYAEAEAYHWQAVRIAEQTVARRPHVLNELSRLAALYRTRALYNRALLFEEQERYIDAEPLFDGARAVFEANLGADHPDMIVPLEHHAQVLRELGRDAEAGELESRAVAIRMSQQACVVEDIAVC